MFFLRKKINKPKIKTLDIRPNIESFIMPTKNAEESFLERPIGSVIIVYELVVLHVIWQLPKRNQSKPFCFFTVFMMMMMMMILILILVLLCVMRKWVVDDGGLVVVVGLIHCFFSFSFPHTSFNETHCPYSDQKMWWRGMKV